MTLWDLRMWIEQRVPIWVPIVLVVVILLARICVGVAIKKRQP